MAINEHLNWPLRQKRQGFRPLQVLTQVLMGVNQRQNRRFGATDQVKLTPDGEEHGVLIGAVNPTMLMR